VRDVVMVRRDGIVEVISGLDRPSSTSLATLVSVGKADSATTFLPGGCVLAHFDHEWHRDDSELLRTNPDHDATMPAPDPFRNPAVALGTGRHVRRPTAGSACRQCGARVRSAHDGPQRGRRGKPGGQGQSNCYSVAASSSCGVRMFRYAGISAIAPKVAPRLRDDSRTDPTRRRRGEA